MRTIRGLLVAVCVLLVTCGPAYAVATSAAAEPGSTAQDRQAAMREDLRKTGVYLETAPAMGDLDRWRQRLEEGVREADLGAPVHVALWSEIPGLWPETDDVSTMDSSQLRKALELPREGVLLTSSYDARVRELHTVSGATEKRVEAWFDQAVAVIERVEDTTPDPVRHDALTAVAKTWIMLRLADADGANAKELIDELGGDPELFQDKAVAPDQDGAEPGPEIGVWTAVTALVVIALVVGVFLRITWVARAAEREKQSAISRARRPDPLIATLTSLALEHDVTDLAEKIAASDLAPGNPAYDGAQACLDAAKKYVDSDLDRDRVGVHLLVADGRTLLGERTPEARCYFHPMHLAKTSVRRREAEFPSCRACAHDLTLGREPAALMVADDDGEVQPYFETEDVWTATGYGAIDERWARRALLAALGAR